MTEYCNVIAAGRQRREDWLEGAAWTECEKAIADARRLL
jgi:hypothetical protein